MMEALLALLFGLLIGSFLNVCIYRWPRDLSVVRPRSHCIACGKTITWRDNIPLVSYLLLRARCRHCGARISLRYPAVELLTGLCFFYFVWTLGPTVPALKMCVLAALLIGLLFADLEERILPDELTLGGTVAGLIFSFFVPVPRREHHGVKIGDSSIGVTTQHNEHVAPAISVILVVVGAGMMIGGRSKA